MIEIFFDVTTSCTQMIVLLPWIASALCWLPDNNTSDNTSHIIWKPFTSARKFQFQNCNNT